MAVPLTHPSVREALLERRDFLRRLGFGVAGAGLPTLLSGCGSDGRSASSSTTRAGEPGRSTTTLDPNLPWWLQGNFGPVTEEVEVLDLEVTGALPPTLSGLFVRNGSNPQTGESEHWFLGDGMLHGVKLEGGRAAWYRNRWVQTDVLGQGMLGNGVPGQANSQSNVSIISHAGRLLSLGEVGWPYEISPADLATTGPYSFGGTLQTSMTAHPKIDPVTGDMHFFGYGFVPPYLTYHHVSADGTLLSSQEVVVAGPTMIHDFAITESDVIFWEGPIVFDLDTAIAASGMPFVWDESYGARVGVMPLGGPAGEIRWVEIDPCYVFHGVNAARVGDDVVLDVCRLPSAFREDGRLEPSAVHRWTIGTAGDALTFGDEELTDVQMDLPGIDRRFVGRDNRYSWYAATSVGENGEAYLPGVIRRDHRSGALDRWDAAEGGGAGELVFVPDGPDAGEGEGWAITYIYEPDRDASSLAVFDALDIAAGPVATVALPVRVPYGFHGWWVAT